MVRGSLAQFVVQSNMNAKHIFHVTQPKKMLTIFSTAPLAPAYNVLCRNSCAAGLITSVEHTVRLWLEAL